MIALFEYGAIALTVFVPFVVLYMKQPVTLDFLSAGLCNPGALYVSFGHPADPLGPRRLGRRSGSITQARVHRPAGTGT
jgi:hypothetical protein